ncbi:MAG: 2'-5' RNA ligase family protein, partial [bacterium]|nr:2'-5' RNA ligase family protein [bacterium]
MDNKLQTTDVVRAFIAINIEEHVKKELCLLMNKLRNDDNQIRWVKKESLHLTLKFLGNISIFQIEDIYKKLQLIADN